MQIRYLIGICHTQNLACATSDLDPPPHTKYHQGRSYGSRDMLRAKKHGRRTPHAARHTDIWITKSLPELSSGETKTLIVGQIFKKLLQIMVKLPKFREPRKL